MYALRLQWLTALCAIAEGAAVAANNVVTATATRMAVFHGRDAQPRSLGSVYGCFVTLFLGFSFRVRRHGIVNARRIAVAPDGATLYYIREGDPNLYACSVAKPSTVLACVLVGPEPRDVCVAPDGAVFVAGRRLPALEMTPSPLAHRRFFGAFDDDALCADAVCANNDIVVTCMPMYSRVAVFHRGYGILLHRLGADIPFWKRGDEYVSTDEDLCTPRSVALSHDGRRVVVADPWMQKLVEFSIEGAFQRIIRIRDVPRPLRVACGPAGELVVTSRECTQVLDHDGRCVMAEFQSTAAALHGTTLFL
jgi:hypothetical protein